MANITVELDKQTSRMVNIISAGLGLSTEEFVLGSINAALETVAEKIPAIGGYIHSLQALNKLDKSE